MADAMGSLEKALKEAEERARRVELEADGLRRRNELLLAELRRGHPEVERLEAEVLRWQNLAYEERRHADAYALQYFQTISPAVQTPEPLRTSELVDLLTGEPLGKLHTQDVVRVVGVRRPRRGR